MNVDKSAGAPNRNAIIDEIVLRTGIDEAMIERLVRTFYGRARYDALLGPIFESTVRDWEAHIAQVHAFWSSVALMSGRYHGQPMVAHLPLPIDTPHFDRWLEISRRPRGRCALPAQPLTSSNVRIASPTASSWALPLRKVKSGRGGSDLSWPCRPMGTRKPSREPERERIARELAGHQADPGLR